MCERELLVERLRTVRHALERIPRRFAGISAPADFHASDAGLDRMDAICMVLIVVGEELKRIDRVTEEKLFPRYPGVRWRGAMAVRDVLAHGYFQVNAEALFDICTHDIPQLIATLDTMIEDLAHGPA